MDLELLPEFNEPVDIFMFSCRSADNYQRD